MVVLVVDDSPLVRQTLGHLLSLHGFECLLADCPKSARPVLETHQIDVVVSDYNMPGENGEQFLAHVREAYPHVRRLLVTSDPIASKNAHHQFGKPFGFAQLIKTVARGPVADPS